MGSVCKGGPYYLPKEFSSLFVCLSVSNFAQKIRTDLHEIFRKGSQWANEQVIKF